MSQLIKHKLTTICSVLMVFTSAIAIFGGTAAATAACYTYNTTTYTQVDCSQLQKDQPSFKPNNSGNHCYGERTTPQGVQISEVDCTAASTQGKDLSNIPTGGTLPQLCGLDPNSTAKNTSGTSCLPSSTSGSNCDGVNTSINFGCKKNQNSIMSLLYAIIRFLAAGVGIILIASVIVAGIQYSASRGDPNATAAAMKRIQSAGAALLLYIFAYALLNYLVPGGFLHP